MCPAARFQTLRQHFGARFHGFEIPSNQANPDAPAPAHSVLTNHIVDETGHPTRQAYEQVVHFFKERLLSDVDGESEC